MARHKLRSSQPVTLKLRAVPKTQQRQLEDVVVAMLRLMTKLYRSQVIDGMHAATVAKFTAPVGVSTIDAAPTGNFSKIFLKLSARSERSLRRRFNDTRIRDMVAKPLGKIDKQAKAKMYAQVEAHLGISTKELTATENLKPHTAALIESTAQWARGLRDKTLETYTGTTLAAMAKGQSLDDVFKGFDDIADRTEAQARTAARTQASTFSSLLNNVRAQNLGVEKAIWETAGDERVRPSHEDRDGKEYDLAKGCYSSMDGEWLQVGISYNCRCSAALQIPGFDTEEDTADEDGE